MNRRLEMALAQGQTMENPRALREVITPAIQDSLFQRAIALERTEIYLRNLPHQTKDILLQRQEVSGWQQQTRTLYDVSLATIIKNDYQYTIHYDHPSFATGKFLRGFLVNCKGPLTGLSVFQLDDGKNGGLLDDSSDKRHFYDVFINILIDSAGLTSNGVGSVSHKGGYLSTKYLVIASHIPIPEVILHFPESRYIPTGNASVIQPSIHEDRLPWAIDFQVV